MSMKKTDLYKSLAKKIDGQMVGSAIPQRFAEGAAGVPDRREQRKLDQALGLVPFACKLPADLVKQLRDQASAYAGGLNGLMVELIRKGMT